MRAATVNSGAVPPALASSNTERGYPASVGSADFKAAAQGWMQRRLGVDVPAEAGHRFGLEFLQAFLYGGEGLGKALQKTRRAAGTAGLAYVAFCPPTVRVSWQEGDLSRRN